MTPMLGIFASQITGHLETDTGAMFPIRSYVVPSSGTASVTFDLTGITGYTNLQIRGIARNTYTGGTGSVDNLFIQLNGDTANNYSAHSLDGYGTTAGAQYYLGETFGFFIMQSGGTGTQPFGAFVLDILDAFNTNKYKTIRGLAGIDGNGYGRIVLGSGSWRNTNAITSIKLFSSGGTYNLAQYSSFALYGVKA
jgi:hypothetical protein